MQSLSTARRAIWSCSDCRIASSILQGGISKDEKRGICLLPDACYLSELNVPGKPNRTNLGKCAAIQRFLSTHPNENLAILTPYRNQRALLADTAKKCVYPQEHDPEVTQEQLHRDIRKEVIVPVLQDLLREDTRIPINTTALNVCLKYLQNKNCIS